MLNVGLKAKGLLDDMWTWIIWNIG